jgi:AcrR family transcriptional regulator
MQLALKTCTTIVSTMPPTSGDALKTDADRRVLIGRKRRAKTRARILSAAFDIFGEEGGLHARIEEISDRAHVTRATFYAHFKGIADLREALTTEVTHDFLSAVRDAINEIHDPRERASVAIRYYLARVREDARWGWSMINLSASGVIFGVATHGQAQVTVKEGIAAGVFRVPSQEIGRDLVLGTTLAAMSSLLNPPRAQSFESEVAMTILIGLGVAPNVAEEISARPLPQLRPCTTHFQT